jgi:hypothetical protein
MGDKKCNSNNDDGKLRNFSQVMSHERLANPDVIIEGGMTAGGHKQMLERDIQDKEDENA